ncbi:MAG TPA: nucleoside-diphosphate kinase [Magnetospirillaceae bacterium]|nr:nucleoside-diphosphate kinase [Magnetospirillaceae bacterium]
MASERTFTMLKPGVLARRIAGRIVSRIEDKGLAIRAIKTLRMDRALAEAHYAEHRGKDFFERLVEYIMSGPVVAMVVEGEGAVSILRRLCGATKPEDAAPGTIRGDFALNTSFNVIHASDSMESAAREIGLFFRPDEIQNWEDGNRGWI